MVRRFDLNAMNWLEVLLEMTLRASFLNWEVRRSFPARDRPAALRDRQPYRPRTPCGRSKPSLAHLPRIVHAARLLRRPCSCGVACALRRAACGEALECGQAPGGYRYLLLELHTHDYASVRSRAIRGCRLRARVRDRATCGKRKYWHVEGVYVGLQWRQDVFLGCIAA